MKKKTAAISAVVLTAGLAVTAYTLWNINGNKSPDSQIPNEQTTTGISEASTSLADDTSDTDSDPSGGNSDIAGFIEITVSEGKYFYENREISFDELIQVLDGLDENTAVRISDDNAALKAYESLTKALEERGILFEAES